LREFSRDTIVSDVLRRSLLIAVLALSLSTPAVALAPQSSVAPSVLVQADQLIDAGQFGRAVDLLQVHRNDPELAARLAAALLKREQFRDALAIAEDAVTACECSQTLAVRSLVLFRAGRFSRAEEDRDRALSVRPVSPLAHLADARLLAARGDEQRAMSAAERALTGTTALERLFFSETHALRAELLENAGRSREAIAALEAALSTAPRTNEMFVTNLTASVAFRRSVVDRPLYRLASKGEAWSTTLDQRHGLLLVTARVNGGPPSRFIVDTGAGISVLFPSAAERFKVQPRPERAFAGAVGGDGKVGLRFALADSVELAGATIENVPFGVIDWELPGYAGILGMPLFERMVVTFDYPGSRLLLRQPTTSSPSQSAPLATAPMRAIGGALFVEVTLNGAGPFNFEVDTGAAPAQVPVDEHVATVIGLHPNSSGARKSTGRGAAGPQSATIYPNVTVGWAKMPDVSVSIMSQPITPARAERRDGESGLTADTEVEGLVGYALLKGRVVTIDYRRRVLEIR
jgi:tetratricopeptide (TPR) repeat protein